MQYLRTVVVETLIRLAMALYVVPLALNLFAFCCLDSVNQNRIINGRVIRTNSHTAVQMSGVNCLKQCLRARRATPTSAQPSSYTKSLTIGLLYATYFKTQWFTRDSLNWHKPLAIPFTPWMYVKWLSMEWSGV